MFTDDCINAVLDLQDKSKAKTLLKLMFAEKIEKDTKYLQCSFNAWNYIAKQLCIKLGYEVIKENEWKNEWNKAIEVIKNQQQLKSFQAFKKFMQLPVIK